MLHNVARKKCLVFCTLCCIYRSLITFAIRELNAVTMHLSSLTFITELCLSFVSAALLVPLNPKYESKVFCIRNVFKSRWQHSSNLRDEII